MWIAEKVSLLYDAALMLVYPQVCAVCEGRSVERRADQPACLVCWRETHVFCHTDAFCWKCGVLMRAVAATETSVAEGEEQRLYCRRCVAATFAAARACGMYEGALRAAVLMLKREPHVPARLVGLLSEMQKRKPLNRATRIMPVPLHSKREQQRGFNQAAVLARAVAEQSGLPLDEHSLTRTRHTERHRAGMDEQARRESVEDAFHVQRPRFVKGESVLLVDDVFTTGATVSVCANMLRAAGAEQVFVLTLARAPGGGSQTNIESRRKQRFSFQETLSPVSDQGMD